ncbi:MAG: carboxyl transferase domain-containing protein, partial [Planctomycetota bacterium]
GATMHAEVSGTADFVEPNDEACLDRLRQLIDLLPKPDSDTFDSVEPEKDVETLYELIDVDARREYDVRDLLAAIVDAGSMAEYKADYGKPIVCSYARLKGRPIGIVASQKVRTSTGKGEVQIGGVVYHQSADKAARFIMDCDQTGVPLLFIQDVTGFMVGKASEQAGIIRSGAKTVNAVSNVRVPKITLVVGGSFGAGNYALCGKGFEPTFIFAWPNARYAVMGGAQAATTLLQLEVRKRQKAGDDIGEEEIAALRKVVEDDYAEQTDIRYGAARGWVDAIIPPHATRDTLALAIEAAANGQRPQRPGYRGGVFQT